MNVFVHNEVTKMCITPFSIRNNRIGDVDKKDYKKIMHIFFFFKWK